MDCWIWSELWLKIRQHPLCKRTWPMSTFLKPSLSFHLMQVLGFTWVHLLHGLDANVTLNLCLMPISEPFKKYVIWYMGDYKEDYEFASLDVAIFIWCLYLHLAICVMILLYSKVQRKSGFLYDTLVYWIASHLSDLFNP